MIEMHHVIHVRSNESVDQWWLVGCVVFYVPINTV